MWSQRYVPREDRFEDQEKVKRKSNQISWHCSAKFVGTLQGWDVKGM